MSPTAPGDDVPRSGQDDPIPSASVAAALQALRAERQRVTPARRAVLDVLDGTRAHLDADQIVAHAADRAPGVHRATVYRALSTLSELGLVSHTHMAGAATVYHLVDHLAATGPDGEISAVGGAHHPPHVHLQCSVCGQVIDVDSSVLDPVRLDLERRLGFALTPEHAALLGVCRSCRDSGAAADGRSGTVH